MARAVAAGPVTMKAPAESGARLTRLGVLLVVVLACWQAREVPDFDFVEFDDNINIVINPHLGPPSAELARWAFTDIAYMRRYLPLGWLGLAGVYGYAGLAPSGYHVAVVLLHLLNSALVYAVLLAGLRRSAAAIDGRWCTAGALLGALAWSVHPLRAETVGWASGWLYEQAGFFALASVWVYGRIDGNARGPRRALWLALTALLYLASMLSYPMSLGLLGVFVAIDWLAGQQGRAAGVSGRRLAAEKLVLLAPAILVLAVTLTAQLRASSFWTPVPAWEDFGPMARLRQAGLVWAYYVVKPWWPVGLTPVSTWLMEVEGRIWLGGVCLAAVGGGSALLWVRRKRWPVAAALWLAHAALLAPMFGLNERPHFTADRYHYLAGVVWAAAIAAGLVAVPGRWRRWALAGGLGAVAGLAAMQQRQLAIWRDTDALMARIVALARPPAVRADFAQRWARHHANRGDLAKANAVAAATGVPRPPVADAVPGGIPAVAPAHLGLALSAARAGRTQPAREHLRVVLQAAPDWAEAAYHAALFYLREGELDEAWRWCWRASQGGLGAKVPLASQQRLEGAVAEAFFSAGRRAAAIGLLERAMRAAEAAPDGPGDVAQLRAQLRRFREAGARERK